MEIIKTTIIRTAYHKTETVAYNIDYSTTDGRLERIGFNVYRPTKGELGEDHLGSIHYDGHTISCNLRWCDDFAAIINEATGFITEIIESANDESTVNTKQR